MTNYRKLTAAEIDVLKTQLCSAADWDQVEVAEGFLPEPVHHTRFSGHVRLGVFQKEFCLPGASVSHPESVLLPCTTLL